MAPISKKCQLLNHFVYIMIKPVRLSYAYSLLLILGQIGLVLFFYKKLPNEIATHFNILNEPDFFMPKVLGTGLFILITLGVFAIFSCAISTLNFL